MSRRHPMWIDCLVDYLAAKAQRNTRMTDADENWRGIEQLEDRLLMSVSETPWVFDTTYRPPTSEPGAEVDIIGDHQLFTDNEGNEYVVEPFLIEPAEPESAPGDGIVWQNYDLSQTFQLHSNEGADHTIYLDFDGHTTTGTLWNNGYGDPIVTPAYTFEGDSNSFTNNELARIQRIWAAVAEDFIGFDVNVTTEDPGEGPLRNLGGSDSRWGVRVVIGENTWFGSAGGVAYVGSFDWSSDTPVFVFNNSEVGVVEAASHEAGHALHLYHDGTSTTGYYTGHGSGATSWSAIMGVGYYVNISHWSKGEYNDANNNEDDLAIITSQNGFGYRADDYGNTIGTANTLISQGASTISATYGIIERNTDNDVFSFWADAGAISIDIDTVANYYNLDILAQIYNSSGGLVASSNPTSDVHASFNTNLASAGEYFLLITGTGKGDPLVDGYTDYGSLGNYRITGTVTPFTSGNTNPVANDDSANTDKETAVSVAVLTNDNDPDLDAISIQSFGQGTNGSVSQSGSNLVYTPNFGFLGNDSFTYTISDGNGGTDTANVTVTVNAVVPPDPKLATGVLTNVGTAGWTTVNLAQSYDSMVVVTTPVHTAGNPPLVTRIKNATGNSFDVMVQRADGSAADISGIEVQYIVVEEGRYSVAQHGINMEAVLYNSTVTDENNSWSGEQRAYINTYAAPVVLGQVMSYNDANFSTFWSRGNAQGNKPDATTLRVGKQVAEDPNAIRADEVVGYIVIETGTGTVSGLTYSAAVGPDIVEGTGNGTDTYSVAGITNAGSAVLSQTAMDGGNGGWAVLAGANAVSGSTITLAIEEDQLQDTERNHITEEVAYIVFESVAVNNDPVANNDGPLSTNEDTDLNNINVLGNDTDADGDSLSVTAASANNGDVTINGDGTLNYSPDNNYNGPDTITYSISDGNGGTDSASVAITVNPINDGPVANNDGPLSTNEDTDLDNINVLGNDTDTDGDTLSVTSASANNGDVTINGDGTLNYSPNNNYNGPDTITYLISDGNGGTDSATVAITVNPVNDGPVANNDGPLSTNEDTDLNNINVLGNDTDIDGDTLSVTSASANNGDVTVNGDGTLNYSPNNNYNGPDTITYNISDGNGGTDSATIAITVNAVNDAPVANDDGPLTTDVDTPLTNINVLGNDTDADGDTLIVTSASATNGDVTINGDGTLNYTPNGGYSGPDTITYSISDGNGGTDSAMVSITVNSGSVDDTDLIAHYTFDGNANDTSPNGLDNSGSTVGDATFVNDTERGTVLSLDGTTDFVDVADSSDINIGTHGQRTVSLWFNANEVTSRQVLFEEGGGTRGLVIYIENGLLYVGGWNRPNGQSGWTGTWLSTAITAGEWHNVTLTLDGTATVQPDAFKGYLDGQLFGSGEGSQLWGHSGDIGIGRNDGQSRYHDGNSNTQYAFSGLIDDVRIYNRALDDSEAETLWLFF